MYRLSVWVLLGLLLVPGLAAAQDRSLRIAFTSHHEKTSDIYVMDIGSPALHNLTRNGALNYFPDWSPDGKRIVFQWQHPETVRNTLQGNDHNQIDVMDADGSNQVNLTNDPSGDYYSPAWSPDSKRIAFVSSQGRNYFLNTMDANGANWVKLTPGVNPAWSPDGRRLAFATQRDGRWDIFLIDVDGSNPIRLTTSPDPHIFSNAPNWSPDGKRIVFVSNRDGNPEIYVMNADGMGVLRLTNTPEEYEEYPKWSPDGKYILFNASQQNSTKFPANFIYIMNADGANRVNVAEGFAPAWVR